jgi:flagellar biosynthesis protein FlhF
MQVKEFRQPTVREAFQAIRDEFGPSALVLSSELVSARGWRGWVGQREVRVTAQAPDGWTPDVERRFADEGSRPADTIDDVSPLVPVPTPAAPAMFGASPAPVAPVSSLAARLVAAGIPPAIAEGAAAGVPSRRQRALTADGVRDALATYLSPHAAGTEAFARVEVFVGPPGVGKTTTIAKIAARERVRGKRALGVVAADAFRAGAVEQLRTLAAIIGAPFRTARTLEDMEQALASSRQTLLVDTAGRSPKDDDVRDVRRLLGRREGVRTHLVIPADTSVASARRIVERFADARPDRVVVSRLDEAEAPSDLFAWLLTTGLPISYVTTGQRVPEDLERATPAVLAAAMLRDDLGVTGAA